MRRAKKSIAAPFTCKLQKAGNKLCYEAYAAAQKSSPILCSALRAVQNVSLAPKQFASSYFALHICWRITVWLRCCHCHCHCCCHCRNVQLSVWLTRLPRLMPPRWLVAATEATCWVNDVVKIAAAAVAAVAVAGTDTVSSWKPHNELPGIIITRSFSFFS